MRESARSHRLLLVTHWGDTLLGRRMQLPSGHKQLHALASLLPSIIWEGAVAGTETGPS